MKKLNGDTGNVLATSQGKALIEETMARLKELREGLKNGDARGAYMADMSLQKQLLESFKAGKISMPLNEKRDLYEATKKSFRGKCVENAERYLRELFKLPALAQSSGGGDAVKPKVETQTVTKINAIDAVKVLAPKAQTVQAMPALANTGAVARPMAVAPVGNVSLAATKL